MEIERKWLVDPNSIPFDLSECRSYTIVQNYISFHPTIRVRNINNGETYILTVKTSTKEQLSKNEYEVELSNEEYINLMQIRRGREIRKKRYLVEKGEFLLEIDIFEGEFEGLAYLEIEFDSVESALSYETPEWVIKDVSSDIRYKNSSLARNGLSDVIEKV